MAGLKHLAALHIVHADIKPDNILVNGNCSTLKFCDFGSGFKSDSPDALPTPYLVSRFYRAPEIILGLKYDTPLDMWSVGTCMYEMFTGRLMFAGGHNNEMLRFQMDVKGRFSNKILKRHRLSYETNFPEIPPHFTEENKFRQQEIDRVTGTIDTESQVILIQSHRYY
jgi:serine/threonine-protein kinase PRP4